MEIGSKRNVCYGLHKLKISITVRKKGTLYGTNDYGNAIIELKELETECMHMGPVTI